MPVSFSDSSNTVRLSSRKTLILLTIVSGVVVFFLGFIAYAKGWIQFPLIPRKEKTAQQNSALVAGKQYTVEYSLTYEPRDSHATPIFTAETADAKVFEHEDGQEFLLDTLAGLLTVGKSGSTQVHNFHSTSTITAEAGASPDSTNFHEVTNTSNINPDKPDSPTDSIAFATETTKVGADLYLKLGYPTTYNLTGITGLDSPPDIEGKWLVITPNDTLKDGSSLQKTWEINNLDLPAVVQNLANTLSTGNVISLGQDLGNEVVGSIPTKHYSITIHPDALPVLYQTLIAQKKATGEDIGVLETALNKMQDPNVQDILQRVIENSKIEAWLDASDESLVQVQWDIIVVPYTSNPATGTQQVRVRNRFTLNEAINITPVTVPDLLITWADYQLHSGELSQSEKFRSQKDSIKRLWKTLQIYKYAVGEYPESFAQLNADITDLQKYCFDRTRTKTLLQNPAFRKKNIQCGQADWYTMKIDGQFHTDMYTNQDFPYQRSSDGSDFTIGYQVQYWDGMDSASKALFQEGSNTATAQYTSAEKKTLWNAFDPESVQAVQNAAQMDPTLPVISNIHAEFKDTNIVFRWITNVDTFAQLFFDPSDASTQESTTPTNLSDIKKEHEFKLHYPRSAIFHYSVKACLPRTIDEKTDTSICTNSGDNVYDGTKDAEVSAPAPTISNARSTVTDKGREISWDVDVISSGDVQYNVKGTVSTSNRINDHQFNLHHSILVDASVDKGDYYNINSCRQDNGKCTLILYKPSAGQ